MGDLHVELMGRGFAWLVAGTTDALLDASDLVQVMERRQGLSIASLEEIAFRQKWIDKVGAARAGAKAGPNALRRIPEACFQRLALLWQIYSRRCSLQIHFRQCGHRCGGSRAMSSRMAWRTAGKVG